MEKVLIGKTALITGANRGIGKSIVKAFVEEGCNVWACARCPNKEFENEIKLIATEKRIWIKPLYFDMLDPAAMKSAILQIKKSKIPLNILVNCAGIFNGKIFGMTTEAEFRKIFDVNFFAPLELTRYAIKLMGCHGGSIINITSVSGIDPHPANTAYGSSKAALIMFTKILASEVAIDNIRVNAIAPGNTDTDMILPVIEKVSEEAMNKLTAMRRFAKPEEIANVAVFLASDKASFINGEVLRVDGGSA